MRGATDGSAEQEASILFQSTRPMRGATGPRAPASGCPSHFNPRAPCGARRRDSVGRYCGQHFNPRAPCGARPSLPRQNRRSRYHFNPRAPCGARHDHGGGGRPTAEFQSTRPMRGATKPLQIYQNQIPFQSTRPMRGATCLPGEAVHL